MYISPRDDGLAPVCPTLLQRIHVLQVIATHCCCCILQISVSPGSPLAVPARRLRVTALVLRPRSPPSCVAPARRPLALVAPAAHCQQCSPSQLAAARLNAKACHPNLHYPPVVPVARAGNLPPRPEGPALFSGQLLNHPPLAARCRSP
jgi:hypothetical protein